MNSGAWGEKIAAGYLIRKGYRILAYNYHSRYGEIDIIAETDGGFVFVEVKTRKPRPLAEGRASIGSSKQDRLRKTALLYLATQSGDPPARFDVIEVTGSIGSGVIGIEHIENAF